MKKLLAALVLSGCSGPQQYPEPPGCQGIAVKMIGSSDCEGFKEAERRALKFISPNVPNAAESLWGWRVYVLQVDGGAWIDQWGRNIKGITYCTRVMQIGTDVWRSSALTHEMIHAIECPWENVSHDGWDVWQNRAIEFARTL